MHVLIIPSWYPRFATDINGVFFREQALALQKSGIKVGVISPQLRSLASPISTFRGPYGPAFEWDQGLPTFRDHAVAWFPKFTSAGMKLWIRRGLHLYNWYVREQGTPDLIHVHSLLNAGLVAQVIRQRTGVPYIVTEHASTFGRGALTGRQIRMAAAAAKSAALCFAVSASLSKLLERKLAADGRKWFVMPNIVEERFTNYPLLTPEDYRDEFRFVAIAVLTENKAIDNVIRAFAQAFGGDSSVTLEIGGEGIEKRRLESLVAQSGLSNRVFFLGALSRDDVIQTISRADVFVSGSRYETFGVVIAEALALGRPVIATKCGGPETIVREEDGFLVPPDDVPSLAQAMLEIRSTYGRFDAGSIKEACIARFSEQVVVRRLIDSYEAVLSEAQRGI